MTPAPPEVTRDLLANTLEDIALLLELQDENPFKIRAYRTGAEIVRSYDGDVVALARDQQLAGIKGLGEALRDKLHELATTGRLEFHRKLRASFPDTLFELFGLTGLGAGKIRRLHAELGIGSLADLQAACEAGRVAALGGFGRKSEQAILAEIARRAQAAGSFGLGEVAPVAERILACLRDQAPTLRAAAAGSYRRSMELVHDLDFLVATAEPAVLTKQFTVLPGVAQVLACGQTKASVRLDNGMQCDLRAVDNRQFPFALQYFTGNKEHNVALRKRALARGLSLNEYGFAPAGKHPATAVPPVEDEDDIYRALGLDPVPPELREHRGELEAAAAGELPRLLELANLRGTFHNHTTASDGRATLDEMAAAAADLGLEYLGIADHSKSTIQARGLDQQRLAAQLARIRQFNRQPAAPIHLFAGSEVDILKDGTLDFDDATLATLDFTVASVHSHFHLDEAAMTRRICRAMEHPQVTMLGHLTGRLLLKRDGYAVDHSAVIDCAAETRTVIELNCNPWRLDMDWRWWRRARDQGVLCSINPDAHHPQHLQFLAFGVGIARKGWLRRGDVINTRPLADIQTFLATPKDRR
jgi:DNA polymerase (family 10)